MAEDTLSPEEFESYAAPQQASADMMTPEQFEAYSSGGGGGQRSDPDTMTPDEFDAYVGTSTSMGRIGRGFAEGLAPGLGGAATGFWAGAAAAPFTGGWSIPIGVIAGLVSGMGIDQAQDYIMEKTGIRAGEGPFSRAQQATDEAQGPYERFGGQMIPALAGSGVGKGLQLGARAIGGTMGGGLTAAVDALQTGEVDPGKVAMGVGAGALFPGANALGRRVMQSGEAAAGRFRGGNKSPTPGAASSEPPKWEGDTFEPADPQRLTGPDVKPTPREGEVTPPERAQMDPDITFAQQQRDGFTQGNPMWTFWDEHLQNLQSRASGKGDPGITLDASQGPHGDQNEFTYHEINRANDLTTVAKGVAAENAPAPRIQEAGNPTGAPMLARDAARPLAATRDYRKLRGPEMAPEGMREGTPLSTAPIHEDIQAALTGEILPPRRDMASMEERGMADIGLGDRQPPVGARQEKTTGFEDFTMPPEHAAHPEDFHYTPENEAAAQARREAAQQGHEPYTIEGQATDITNQRKLSPPRKPVIHEDLTRPQPETPTPEVRLAPEDQYKVDTTRRALAQHGMKDVIDRLNRLPPEQQMEAAERIKALLEAHGKAEYDKSNRPTLPTGVQGRSKADAARKGGALEAIERATAKFGGSGQSEHVPTTLADRQALVGRLQAMWDHAVELNGGRNPIDRKEGYAPHEKTPAWTALRAAKRVLDKPTPANIREYFSAEKALGEGKPGEGNVFQETERIEADIAKRPHITNQAALDAIQAKAHVEDTGPERYPELDRLLRPVRLKSEGDESLTNRPGQVELVPAEDVKGKPQRVKTAADVAKVEGRSIDPNSPAGRAIAAGKEGKLTSEELAAYKANKGRKTNPETKEQFAERLAREKELAKNPERIPENKDPDLEEKPTGSWKDLADRFAKDTRGEVPIPEWLKRRSWNPFSPTVRPEVLKSTEYLRKEFPINDGVMRNVDAKLSATQASEPRLTPDELQAAYEKREMNKPLTAREQEYVNHWKPVQDWADRLYRTLRKQDPTLPEQYVGGTARHVPRMGLDEATAARPVDEAWKRDLGNWTGSLEDRMAHSLDDGKGMRVTFKFNEDGDVVLMRKGAQQKLNTPAGFTGKTGETVTFKVGGKNRDFTVDHATSTEIETDMPGAKFIKNYGITLSNAVRNMQASLIKSNILERIKRDHINDSNSTTDKEVARRRGYEISPTKLEELAERNGKTVYYHDQLKWLFDDFAKPGFDLPQKLANFANAAIRPLYIVSPLFHPLNVAHNWALSLANHPEHLSMFEAAKQVWTQGPVVKEIQQAGGRLMKASVLFDGGVIRDMMQKAGIEMARTPGALETVRKATGLDMSGAMKAGMNWSNKTMWSGNDMFYIELYLRNKKMGLSPRDAVEATERWIGAYDSKSPTFAGSRIIQQAQNTSAISYFGRYHQDLWRTMGIMKDVMLGKERDPRVRREVGSALLMSGLLMFGLYPYVLDKATKAVTGNEEAEFGRRGLGAITDIGRKVHEGKTKEAFIGLGRQIGSPSIPVTLAGGALSDMDWRGKDIIPDLPLDSPKAVARAAAHGVNWAAKTAIPPYGTAMNAAEQRDATPLSVLKKFGESTIGIKDPSAGAQRFETLRTKRQHQEERRLGKSKSWPEWMFGR